MTETDTYEKDWGLQLELELLAPRLPPGLHERFDALGGEDADRFPPTMSPALRVLDLAGWVFYDRRELGALLAAYDAATDEEREHLSPWWWESLREGAEDPRYDLLALAIF